MEQAQTQLQMEEEEMQQLRSKATELLIREEWSESIHVYSQFISLCQTQISKTLECPEPDRLCKLRKSICLAFSNRAESRSRLRYFDEALKDCDEALKIDSTHFKTLVCKGKILLNFNKYSMALDCFKAAAIDCQANGNFETVNGYVEKCKKLEFQSRTGSFDLSDWVVNGFRGKSPELAEYVGPVQIQRSDISGRGLFATKNIDAGTLVLVTKAVAIERGILPDSGENAQLVMWKKFIDEVTESISKCHQTHRLISILSTGDEEDGLEVADISQFKHEIEQCEFSSEKIDMGRILSILDVNSLIEDAISAKVLGKNRGYYAVGLWVLASFINHSCSPNARRLHIGDYVMVHVSRDVKAGEELTFAYFDVLSPLNKRKEMSGTWGFRCKCNRCKFEEGMFSRPEMSEIEMGIERGLDVGGAVYRLEEGMRKWMVRGKSKGYLRSSFWATYSEAYGSEKSARKFGRRIPEVDAVVDSVVEAVGSDERILKVVVGRLKRNGGVVEMERAMKFGRGVYGKVVKKQAMRTLLELCLSSTT